MLAHAWNPDSDRGHHLGVDGRHDAPARSAFAGSLPLYVGIAAVAVVVALVIRSGWHRGPGMPLDDPYIYFDYARSAASGAWLQYQPGDHATSGSTSLLWMAMLAVGYRGGLTGSAILWWDIALETACIFGTVILLYRTLTAAGVSIWASSVLAASVISVGTVLLPALTGLEVALTLLAITAFMWSEITGRRRMALAVAVLMPLIRPDVALVFGIVLPLAWGMRPLWGRTASGWLPGLSVGAYAVLMWVISGHPELNGGAAKILWLMPGASLAYLVHHAAVGVAACLLGLWGVIPAPLWDVPLLMGCSGVLWVLASLNLGRSDVRRAGMLTFAGLACAGVSLEGVAFGATFPFAQFARYLTPYVPLLVVSAAAGATMVRRGTDGSPPEGKRGFRRLSITAPAILAGLCAVTAALALMPARTVYANAVREISQQQVYIGRWIARALPPSAVIVVNDAGAMAYYGGHYTIDAMGIATDGFATAARAPGQPQEWSTLVRYVHERGLAGRPLYAVVFPNWLSSLVHAGYVVRTFRLHGHLVVDGPKVDVVRLPTVHRTARRIGYSPQKPHRPAIVTVLR